jgi:hypothetical protein
MIKLKSIKQGNRISVDNLVVLEIAHSAANIALRCLLICFILFYVIFMWATGSTFGDTQLVDDFLGLLVICLAGNAVTIYFDNRIKEINLSLRYMASLVGTCRSNTALDKIFKRQRKIMRQCDTGNIKLMLKEEKDSIDYSLSSP